MRRSTCRCWPGCGCCKPAPARATWTRSSPPWKKPRPVRSKSASPALDDFRRTFEQINREHVEKRGRLVVFVDDLDRCLPERAVEALEAIKLFLDVPGCIFVLGVDRQVIERGIQVRYKDFDAGSIGPILLDGARYLEKIIQIPFSLPPAKAEAMRGFVERMTEGRLSDPRCAEVFRAWPGAQPAAHQAHAQHLPAAGAAGAKPPRPGRPHQAGAAGEDRHHP